MQQQQPWNYKQKIFTFFWHRFPTISSLFNQRMNSPGCQEFIPHQMLLGTLWWLTDLTYHHGKCSWLISCAQKNSFNALIMTSEERHQQHLTWEWTSALLHLPTDEEDIIFFLQIQLAGNLKGPLDCFCNCWKIREQRTEKNATRAEMGVPGWGNGALGHSSKQYQLCH